MRFCFVSPDVTWARNSQPTSIHPKTIYVDVNYLSNFLVTNSITTYEAMTAHSRENKLQLEFLTSEKILNITGETIASKYVVINGYIE